MRSCKHSNLDPKSWLAPSEVVNSNIALSFVPWQFPIFLLKLAVCITILWGYSYPFTNVNFGSLIWVICSLRTLGIMAQRWLSTICGIMMKEKWSWTLMQILRFGFDYLYGISDCVISSFIFCLFCYDCRIFASRGMQTIMRRVALVLKQVTSILRTVFVTHSV